MPKRPSNKYERPRKPFDILTLKSQGDLIKKYGLKSRREVWKADFQIGTIRDLAKTLITAPEKDRKEFTERQAKKGFAVSTIQEVLGLGKEDSLKRRLESVVAAKFGMTHRLARQLITHKHVKIGDKMIKSPGHLTTVEEEANLILTVAVPTKQVITSEEKQILNKIQHKETKVKEAKEE